MTTLQVSLEVNTVEDKGLDTSEAARIIDKLCRQAPEVIDHTLSTVVIERGGEHITVPQLDMIVKGTSTEQADRAIHRIEYFYERIAAQDFGTDPDAHVWAWSCVSIVWI